MFLFRGTPFLTACATLLGCWVVSLEGVAAPSNSSRVQMRLVNPASMAGVTRIVL